MIHILKVFLDVRIQGGHVEALSAQDWQIAGKHLLDVIVVFVNCAEGYAACARPKSDLAHTWREVVSYLRGIVNLVSIQGRGVRHGVL